MKQYFLSLMVALFCMKESQQCDIKVCFTWYIIDEKITFVCKILDLRFAVYIFDPYGTLQAHCSSPIPTVDCYPNYPNGSITQNISNSETIYTVKGKPGKNILGKWTCRHGFRLYKANVEVTLLNLKATEKTLHKDCLKTYVCWTLIGLSISFFLTFLVLMVLKNIVWRSNDNDNGKTQTCSYLLDKVSSDYKLSSVTHSKFRVLKIAVVVILSLMVVLFPVIFGMLNRKTCTDDKYFIGLGAISGLMCSLFCNTKRDKSSNNERRDEDVDQNLVQQQHRNIADTEV